MIITRLHPRFPEFVGRMEKQLRGCCHDHAATIEVLNQMGADIPGTIEYLRDHGGYCDCEVMMNVVCGERAD